MEGGVQYLLTTLYSVGLGMRYTGTENMKTCWGGGWGEGGGAWVTFPVLVEVLMSRVFANERFRKWVVIPYVGAS